MKLSSAATNARAIPRLNAAWGAALCRQSCHQGYPPMNPGCEAAGKAASFEAEVAHLPCAHFAIAGALLSLQPTNKSSQAKTNVQDKCAN